MTQDTLKTRLIDAGLDILTEQGLSALTLRACAARAGVSHAAPAHHFAGLPGLLAGIIAQGFKQFADMMEEDQRAADQTPLARLAGICTGYVRFSRTNPALFTLMFNTQGEIMRDYPDFQVTSGRAYNILRDACAPFQPVTDHADATEVLVWSLVHGLATLQLGAAFNVSSENGPAPSIEDLIHQLPLTLRDQRNA